jgi:hypothetical protein
MSVNSVLFFVEPESRLDIADLLLLEGRGREPNVAAGGEVHAGECQSGPPLPVRILDDLQRLFIVMTVNSVLPMFANHEFCARRPPFGQEISVRDLPMMPFIRYPQRQAPLLAPLANVRLVFQIRS